MSEFAADFGRGISGYEKARAAAWPRAAAGWSSSRPDHPDQCPARLTALVGMGVPFRRGRADNEGMRKAVVMLVGMLAFLVLATGCALVASPASARLILPARTMTAGSQLTGRVIVDNRSGHILQARGCGSPVDVTLSSSSYHPAGVAPDCAGTLTIPAGQSTYTVKVLASYLSCSVGHADVYQATLYTVAGVATPAPMAIRVTQP
jgi:hypothetical protein